MDRPDTSSSPVGTAFVHFGPPENGEAGGGKASVAAPRAILICHGMGEQVRYATISSVAGAILTEAKKVGNTVAPVVVHLSNENNKFLARAELRWTDQQSVAHEVHVFEAYWAPITEGRVTYWDTAKFLLEAGIQGLRGSKLLRVGTFQRWMFDGPKTMSTS